MALKELQVGYADIRDRDYKLTDGAGLYLLVRPNRSKLWRFKYRFDGKEKLLALGRYPELGIADARLCREEAKLALRQGRDPGAKPETYEAMTFEQAARAWHEHRSTSLNPGHASRLLARLERDAFPALGRRELRAVKSADVLAMVRTVEARGALDVSRRRKQHVSQIYRFAIPHGWAETDPAAVITDMLKPKPRVQHMARVGLKELPELVRAIDRYDGDETPRRRAVTRAALLFTMLTWARTNETRLATWDEFEGLDGPEPLWRVPASRMKMEREHLVPLAPQAVALLADLRTFSRGAFVFCGEKPDQPISQNTMIYGCYRMGYRTRQTVHGFRALASIWANEAECYRPDWIELALAHAERDEVRGAYNSALYLTLRRRMLSDWAAAVVTMIAGPEAPPLGPTPQKMRCSRVSSDASAERNGRLRGNGWIADGGFERRRAVSCPSFSLSRLLKNSWFCDKGGVVAIVVGDFAFEPAIVAQIGPAGAGHLIAFISTIPMEIDPARGEPAVDCGAERPERHFAGAIGVDTQESRAAQIEVVARPCSALHDPPCADEGGARDHHPVSRSLGSLTRL